MQYVITGASGFIGTKLVESLTRQDIKALSIDRTNFRGYVNGDLSLGSNYHLVHLAAMTSVVESWDKPSSYFEFNALGTMQVLERCRLDNASMTYISSYPYGAPKFLPITEDHPLTAVNPYGFSKIVGEYGVNFYVDNYSMNANILRVFNVYGHGQPPHLLMQEILAQALDPSISNIEVKDLNPKRDFVHVSDVINAIVDVAGKYPGEAFNIGSGESHSVETILDTIIKVSAADKTYSQSNQVRKNDIPDVVAEVSKIKAHTGWTPQITLQKGIEMLVKQQIANTNQLL